MNGEWLPRSSTAPSWSTGRGGITAAAYGGAVASCGHRAAAASASFLPSRLRLPGLDAVADADEELDQRQALGEHVELDLPLQAESRINLWQRIQAHQEDAQADAGAGTRRDRVWHQRQPEAAEEPDRQLVVAHGEARRQRKELPAAREGHGDVGEARQRHVRRELREVHGPAHVEAELRVG